MIRALSAAIAATEVTLAVSAVAIAWQSRGAGPARSSPPVPIGKMFRRQVIKLRVFQKDLIENCEKLPLIIICGDRDAGSTRDAGRQGLDPKKIENAMEQSYKELLRLLGRLHCRHADVVRLKLAALGVDDITPVQAMLLIDIGESEISVRDLIERGCYLSTTATYNIRKLIEAGYLDQTRAPTDRRLIRLRLTERGRSLKEKIECPDGGAAPAEPENWRARLDEAIGVLRELERGWFDYLRSGHF